MERVGVGLDERVIVRQEGHLAQEGDRLVDREVGREALEEQRLEAGKARHRGHGRHRR